MGLVDGGRMLAGEPLPGWHGRYFHSETMTFSLYDIDADAVPLHEHHHPEEEVWNVVSGELALVIDGVEHTVRAGQAAVVPPDTVHSARALGAVSAIVTDHPVRHELPGNPQLPN